MATILERNKNVRAPRKTREDYAEDALYREVWEEVNNEKTQRFLKKYGRVMMAGALVLMIIAVGVQIGVQTVRRNRMARAQNYEAAIESMDARALAAMANDSTGAMSDLALFQSYVISGDMATLEKLAARGATRDFRDLARIHLAARRGDDMTAADIEKYFADLVTKKSPFYYTSRLMLAQKYLATGDTAAATKILDKIIADKDAPAIVSANAAALR